MLSEIPGKLKSLASDGYRIVFITNQAGISKGKLKEEDFCEKAENILRKLGVPVLLMCSTADKGFFRKPRPGIWLWFRNEEYFVDLFDFRSLFLAFLIFLNGVNKVNHQYYNDIQSKLFKFL